MKILVVDDEQHFGSLVCRTLKRLGHNPILALHPWDALELIDSDIDAVISDIDMPAMKGGRVRWCPPTAPSRHAYRLLHGQRSRE